MEVAESLIDLVFLAFMSMVPLLLGAVGEIINERSGVVNIGIEGIFLLSALTSTIVNYFTNNLGLALLTGVITGMAIGLLHGLISTYLRGDQIVAGVGLNVFAYGMSVIALVTIWGTFGNSPSVSTIPKLKVLGHAVSPLVPTSIAIAVVVWYFLYRTGLGLRLRACGEDPKAAEAMGVNVLRTRLLATVIGASLAGLGGSYLSIDWVGQFTKEISAGRGFIALANVAFSNWNPLTAILGAFIFGFFDALAIHLSIVSLQPALAYLFKTIPYLGTLAVVSIFFKRTRIPPALGKPYIKE
mgnify:FL=1